jgi:hypothetical protein
MNYLLQRLSLVIQITVIVLFLTNLYYYFYHNFQLFRPIYIYLFYIISILIHSYYTDKKNLIDNNLWFVIVIIYTVYCISDISFIKEYPLEFFRNLKLIVLGSAMIYSLNIINFKTLYISNLVFIISIYQLFDFFYLSADYQNLRYLTGIYLNPNQVGAVLPILLCIITTNWEVRFKIKTILIILVGVVILFTYSRSGYIMYLTFLVHLFIKEKLEKKHVIAILSLGFSFLLLFIEGKIIKSIISENYYEKLGFGERNILLSGSTSLRFENLIYCWDRFLEKPLFGHGLHFFFENGFVEGGRIVGAHNMFAKFAVERGLFGIAILTLILLLMIKYTYKDYKIIVLLIFIQCIFSHNILENPTFILFFSFVISNNYFKHEISFRKIKLILTYKSLFIKI